MRIQIMLIVLSVFSSLCYSQIVRYQDLSTLQSAKVKASTYIASNEDTFSVGTRVYFDNYVNSNDEVPYLKENIGKGLIRYYNLKDLVLKIYKVKFTQEQGTYRVDLVVFDEESMFKFRLDLEEAIASDQVFIEKENKMQPPSVQENGPGELTINNQTSVVSGAPIITSPNHSPIEKEMLLMSALELKKFNRGYNRSLMLTAGGTVLTAISPFARSVTGRNGAGILGLAMIVGGGIQGIAARQHIGKSGAYLEAYANGVRIQF